MQHKENVYEDTTLTGASAQAQEGKEIKDVSTVLGKFKDVDALLKAYSSLEAEFTRRSQRLKELEKEVENFEKSRGQEGRLGAEKLRKTAESRREAEKKFDEFVKTVEGKEAFQEDLNPTDLGNAPISGSEIGEGSHAQDEIPSMLANVSEPNAEEEASKTEEKALKIGEMLAQKEKTSELFSSKEVYEKAMENEEIRLKIIGEYLSSLGKSSAPLTTGGSGILKAQPVKVRSIVEAGDLAAQYFKNGNGEK